MTDETGGIQNQELPDLYLRCLPVSCHPRDMFNANVICQLYNNKRGRKIILRTAKSYNNLFNEKLQMFKMYLNI